MDGQKQYHAALEKSMREYMTQHAGEFAMQGADGKPIPNEEPATDAGTGVPSTNVEKQVLVQPDVAAAQRRKEDEANAFQYAFDLIVTGLKALGSGVWALLGWGGDMLSGLPGGRDLGLLVVILALLLSNWWTYNALKGKNSPAVQESEARRAARLPVSPVGKGPEDVQRMVDVAVQKYFGSSVEPGGNVDLGSQTAAILRELNALEERIVVIRTGLIAVDVVGEVGFEEMREGHPPVSGALDTLE